MIFRQSSLKSNLNRNLTEISKKKTYLKALQSKITDLRAVPKLEYRELNFRLFKQNFQISSQFTKPKFLLGQSNLISYVIAVTVTRTNFHLNISDSLGRLKLSVSSRNLFGRIEQKRKVFRPLAVNSVIAIILKQSYLVGRSLALYFKTSRWPMFIPSKLRRTLRKKRKLSFTKFIYSLPCNGCRKKKVRTG
jgi:hypothetical protein